MNLPNPLPDHDGRTYDSAKDKFRLNTQQWDVFQAMKDGGWWTLSDLSLVSGHPEASVSARIRDFRKEKFGCFVVDSERVVGMKGLWRYRLHILPEQSELFDE